jgi:hypothetical protein
VAQPNADLVQRMLRAFNAGNVDAVLATFTDECVLREPPEMQKARPRASGATTAFARGWRTSAMSPGSSSS